MEPNAGRRDYDHEIDPVVVNFVEARLRETRHLFVNEIKAISIKVDTMALASTAEHGLVTAKLDRLLEKVEVLERHEPRIAALERREAIEQAEMVTRDKLRKQSRNQFFALAGLIVAAVPAAAAVFAFFAH